MLCTGRVWSTSGEVAGRRKRLKRSWLSFCKYGRSNGIAVYFKFIYFL